MFIPSKKMMRLAVLLIALLVVQDRANGNYISPDQARAIDNSRMFMPYYPFSNKIRIIQPDPNLARAIDNSRMFMPYYPFSNKIRIIQPDPNLACAIDNSRMFKPYYPIFKKIRIIEPDPNLNQADDKAGNLHPEDPVEDDSAADSNQKLMNQNQADDKARNLHPEDPVEDDSAADSNQKLMNQIYAALPDRLTRFTLNLSRAISKSIVGTSSGKKPNVIFSPLNIASTLAMILLGSAGVTFKEVSKILGLDSEINVSEQSEIVHSVLGATLKSIQARPINDEPEIELANGIFVQTGCPIRDEFKAVSQGAYNNTVIPVDFEAKADESMQVINNWIESKTHGKIRNMLAEPVDADAGLIIASTLYFNGFWLHKFESTWLESVGYYMRQFWVTPRKAVYVVNMSVQQYLPFSEDKKLGVQMVGLPYKGNASNDCPSSKPVAMMYVLLPLAKHPDALVHLENNLTAENLESMISRMQPRDLIVSLPRMELSSSLSLKKALNSLGLKSLFRSNAANFGVLSPGCDKTSTAATSNQETTTDFDGMARLHRQGCTADGDRFRFSSFKSHELDPLRNRPNLVNPGLYASDVLHKVEMNITEIGTTAAAATLATLNRIGGHQSFYVDKPFLFFIRHESTKTILFWGTVNNPTPNWPRRPGAGK